MQHCLAYSSLQIYAQLNSFEMILSALPKVLPVEHHHYFTDRSMGLLAGGIGLLLISAITIGLSIGLIPENNRSRNNDINYRMIRQSILEIARWADTSYHRNPVVTEKVLENLEPETLIMKARTAQIKIEEKLGESVNLYAYAPGTIAPSSLTYNNLHSVMNSSIIFPYKLKSQSCQMLLSGIHNSFCSTSVAVS